jgi:hyperosmotically inducible protein
MRRVRETPAAATRCRHSDLACQVDGRALAAQSWQPEDDMHQKIIPSAIALSVLLVTGCTTMTGRSAGTYIDDNTTTAIVKSKLVSERPANLTAVSVTTVNGVVYLTGAVTSPEQRQRAEAIASQASGVREVVNNIQVHSSSASPPPSVTLPPAVVTQPATPPVSASPATSARRYTTSAVVQTIDRSRNQVTATTGDRQLQLQLPAAAVTELRPGDEITVDVTVRPGR